MDTVEQITGIIKACAKSLGIPAKNVQFSKKGRSTQARHLAMYMCYKEGIEESIIMSAFDIHCTNTIRLALRKIDVAVTTQKTPEQDQIATDLANADLEYNLICESFNPA